MNEIDIPKIMRGAGKAVKAFEEALESVDLTGYRIDEIAYQFNTLEDLDAFTVEAVCHDGCLLFNAANDHVHTLPMRTCYGVAYRFFTIPMEYLPEQLGEVRIEAMLQTSGLSPLHLAGMWSVHGRPLAVHASFKCVNEEQYAAVCHRLRQQGWESPQRCESSYGRFSYWTPVDRAKYEDLPFMYLKPRVNLRDQVSA